MLPELVKGEWPPREKLSHQSVSYEHPAKRTDEHCSLCEHYISSMEPRCQHVKSPILAGDWCERYELKQ